MSLASSSRLSSAGQQALVSRVSCLVSRVSCGPACGRHLALLHRVHSPLIGAASARHLALLALRHDDDHAAGLASVESLVLALSGLGLAVHTVSHTPSDKSQLGVSWVEHAFGRENSLTREPSRPVCLWPRLPLLYTHLCENIRGARATPVRSTSRI